MHNEAAELCKYAANTYLAMRIAYVNELADICEAVGADVGDVTAGMGFDKRIGRHYLSPGPGFGGSCFPKDTRALLATTRSAGVNFSLGEAIIYSNDRRKELLKSRVVGALGGSVAGRTIAILGLAFKADTDDVRDSAALPLIEALQGEGAAIRAFDPEAMPQAATSLHGVAWCKDTYEAATGADAAVIMTEWEVFRRLDLKRLATLLCRPLLIDFRNLHAPQAAAEAGLGYVSIGRPAAHG
jgi:UDPglucose 6-dehydrogenase